MFRSRNLKKNVQTNKSLKAMAAICPFNDEDDFSQDDFSLEEDETDSGVYFECKKKCKESKCTGYLRK